MSKTFLIADLHFGDQGIIRYEKRPFSTVEEMDRTLIANWNETVSEEDTVFVLGDFSRYGELDGNEEEDRSILAKLKGRKILILGNHDRHRSCAKWRELGFDECVEWPIVYKEFFLLSHEPLYLNSNMPYANFFGHVHGNPMYTTVSKQSFCLSVERIDYRPITFEEAWERCKACGEAN